MQGKLFSRNVLWGLPPLTHAWLCSRSQHRVLGNASPQVLFLSSLANDHDSGCPRPVNVSLGGDRARHRAGGQAGVLSPREVA